MKFARNLNGRRFTPAREAKVRPQKRANYHGGIANWCRNIARLGNKLHLCCGASVFEVSESKITECPLFKQNAKFCFWASVAQGGGLSECIVGSHDCTKDKHGNRLGTLEALVLTWWYSGTNIYWMVMKVTNKMQLYRLIYYS